MRASGSKRALIAGVVAALLAVPATAWSAATIVAGNSLDYSQALYTQAQGERAVFRNIDSGIPHNVTARGKFSGKPLFRSNTITGSVTGTQAPVSGTQFLLAGDYVFFCSVHPNMEAVLRVSSAGTPVARPNIRLAILTGAIEKAQAGKVRVKVRALTKSNNVALKLKLGTRVLASRRNLDFTAGQVRKPVLKLGAAARARLMGRSQAKLTLVGRVPYGKARSVRKLLD